MSEKKKDGRTRNWTFVLYPDSAPDNWRELLDDKHIEWIESPLHDKDVNANGEPKKPHWHILVLFGGVKSFDQVRDDICQELNATIPQPCHNARALVRYMAHLDNPDKAQYDVSKIIAHGGIDIADLTKPSSSERYTYIREMISYCCNEDIREFEDLLVYASAERSEDWFPLLCDSCAYVMGQFLKSRRHNPRRLSEQFDGETGEILE